MASDVDSQSSAVIAMSERWPMIDALIGGTSAMRKAAKEFLPQFPSEPNKSYQARLATATLFPAFSRTTEVLAAKPMSKAIQFDGVPPQIEDLFDDIDGEGSTLHAFASALMLACIQYGIGGVLVDYPPVPAARTKEDEMAIGGRPYFARYAAASILGWRAERGALTQLRLMESVVEPDGDFGESVISQVRVLTPGAWQTWRKVKQIDGREAWAVNAEGKTSLDVIPFVFFYGIREGYGIGRPPLTDLAFLNIEHWQSSSDQQTILHTARVPILFVKGLNQTDEITVGASSAIQTTAENADIKFVEHSGAAITAGRQSILDLEDRMRQTGAELLVQQSMTVTATQTISEGEGSRSILQRIVESFEESLEECVELMGKWIGIDFECEVTLFKDFGATNLSDQSSNILIAAADKGYVSPQTVFQGLQRRDIVPPDVKWDDEQKLIAEEAKANAKANPLPPVNNVQQNQEDNKAGQNADAA
jgi:Domain of unknown function (DUF4055)